MLQVTRLGRFARFAPLLVGVGSAVALSAAPAAASSSLAPPPVRDEDRATGGDHLTVTVRNAGGDADGTYEVDCHPGGGSHPDAGGACAVVERNTRWGKDAFAAVPRDSVCTMQYGGPATAHVTGTWAGRPVDARFDRSNGCEIGRWDRLVPLLPEVGRQA
ncbi:SSI family serine proteinase inhibitor [Streptomyces sp. AC555_RSS877]|uniref:SSI family serine proteinase inhibitor n=1 Tax=Streptomyces sp. AC555_RSS877 TaxID=2823688 RepID=UPI001C2560D4|nr:SSI family serine proteinase inhibitor [Streptomyces sp. AC555_RSS877]